MYLRSNHLGEVGEGLCVEGICYSQLAGRSRKIQDLPWIHHDDREAVGGECAREGYFKPPSGHEHNEHWDGIVADYKPENKVAMGLDEGVNNKIRVMQRRSYGLRDEEYLRLKVLTCMLDPI